MNFKRIISLVCVIAIVACMFVGCGGTQNNGNTQKTESTAKVENTQKAEATQATNDPRKETLFINGIQWGAPANFNMLSGNPAFPCTQGRLLVYESLFMYNQLTGGIEPLLGKSYEWADQYTLKVTMNKDAHFNDGKPLTAEDVAYSYMLSKKYTISWSNIMTFIDEVVAESPEVVAIKLKKDNYNRLVVMDSLQNVPIHPKHIWTEIEKKCNNNLDEIRKEFNANPVASGAYKVKSYDDTKITLERDDNYWGKALFGKLPGPKYITHIIFKDNNAGNLALKNGDLDISQQFIPKVWEYWKDGSPVKTYLDEAPYYLPGALPSIFFNVAKKGLDVPEVRKAIAMSIDYAKIGEVAMSGYTAPIEPGLTLLTPAEIKYIDKDKIKSLQWTTDVDGANKLLDSIGAAKGADGIRVYKGTRLGPFEIECPYGWSDWNASLEIVAQGAKKIGIEIKTKFPEAPVWTNDRQTGKFDIIMDSPSPSLAPSQPWDRARCILFSEGVAPVGQTAFWNWGRFKDARADEIIKLIPQKTDENELKALYTELDEIYLKNVPTVPLMYRPWLFYTVSEKVWKGFPTAKNNPNNIPPQMCVDGAGIKALFEIHN